VGALGFGTYLCEIPAEVLSLYIINVGAVITQALVIAICVALIYPAVPQGKLSLTSLLCLAMALPYEGLKADNDQVPMIAHKSSCNMYAFNHVRRRLNTQRQLFPPP
jgi:hypothetical protein